jgi:Antibiotic biosynthesis monooxygenase
MWLSRSKKQSMVVGAATIVIILGLAITAKAPLGHAQQKTQGSFDLVGGLKAVPGCLGVETAQTASGKKVIFAWFEDKKAVLRWYESDMHQGAMKMLLGDRKPDPPLQGVPDEIGPVLVIASLTMSDKSQYQGVSMPISQISIELYKPVTGGIFLGSRFAPESLRIPGMKDYTPRKEGK